MFFGFSLTIYLCLLSLLRLSLYADVAIVHSQFCQLGNLLRDNSTVREYIFNKARSELGLNNLYGFRYENKRKFIDYLFTFKNENAYYITNISGKVVAYKRILKAANNFLRYGITQVSSKNHTNSYFNTHIDDVQLNKLMQNTTVTVFSFVRDPIHHFDAGIREWLQRYAEDKQITTPFSLQDIRMLLYSLFEGMIDWNERHMAHIFPYGSQFGLLKDNTMLIGRVETLNPDIQIISNLSKIPELGTWFQSYHGHAGSHVSSLDGLDAGKHLTTILQGEPQLMRALCWYHIVEYTCFNYTLPDDCAGIEASSINL